VLCTLDGGGGRNDVFIELPAYAIGAGGVDSIGAAPGLSK
jgi:hypothetical protein